MVKPSFVVVFVTLLTSFYYLYQVTPACLKAPTICYERHVAIVHGTADAPYRYRLLAPALIQLLATSDRIEDVARADAIFHLICFAGVFSGLYRWLRVWADEYKALFGVMVMALIFPLAFQEYYLSPWAALEIAVICWSLVCLSFTPRWSSSPA